MKRTYGVLLFILCFVAVFCCAACGSVDTATMEKYMDGEENVTAGDSAAGGECTIEIDCKTILDNREKLKANKKEYVPADGVILPPTTVAFEGGESVLDVLKRVTRDNGIQLEFAATTSYGSAYIEGIGNLYELDCGSESGWTYTVNDRSPNYGCSKYILTDGDVIKWLYTCKVGDVMKEEK